MFTQWLIIVGSLAIAMLLVVLLIRTTLVVVTVELQSMSPTLEDGDRVLAIRYWLTQWLHKGQIVLVQLPLSVNNATSSLNVPLYIKRVVAVAGETISTSITDIPEVLRPEYIRMHDSQGKRVWYVPSESCFVRGDAPMSVSDSLTWGPISTKNIQGVVLMKLPRRATSSTSRGYVGTRAILHQRLQVGQLAPNFIAQTLDGEQVSLAHYAGHAFALLFIAPSTVVCQNMLSYFEKIARKAEQTDVRFVLVSSEDTARTRAIIEQFHIHLSVLIAPCENNPFFKDYKAVSIPSYCVVDAQGFVQSVGYPSEERHEWRVLVKIWESSASIPSDTV